MNGEGKSYRRISDEDYHSPAILTDQPPRYARSVKVGSN